MFLRIITLVGLLMIGPYACKDGPGSGAKSAKDLISGSEKNKEKPAEEQPAQPAASQNAEPAIAYCAGSGSADSPAQALAALYKRLPERLAVEFIDYKQRFRLSNNKEALAKTCAAAVADQTKVLDAELNTRAENLDSCWLAEAPKDGQTPVPNVYLLESTATVNQSLIPMAVYAYVEFYMDKLLLPQAGSIPETEPRLRQDLDEFPLMRKNLAVALVQDLKQGEHNDTLDIYKKRFKVDKSTRLPESVDFQNFALAETAEAMWCSKSSKEDMDRLKLVSTKEAFGWFDEFFSRPLQMESQPKDEGTTEGGETEGGETEGGDTEGTTTGSDEGSSDVVDPGGP